VSLAELLGSIVGGLDDAGIPHMIAGSVASTFHGEPRSTQDVDLVIDPPNRAALDRFASRLDRDRFYVGDHRAAFAERGMFNVIDTRTGWKVDLIIRRDRPFSRAEFARRRPARIEGVDVAVASPEDVILAKLEWARLGESDRQLGDVRAVLRSLSGELDWAHLRRWAEELGVAETLAALAP
jgi:hypothetical protein